MTNTEQLTEAISYANENDINWWDVVGSKKQAKRILNGAIKEQPDEEEIIFLLNELEVDIFESGTLQESYSLALKKLKQEFEEEA